MVKRLSSLSINKRVAVYLALLFSVTGVFITIAIGVPVHLGWNFEERYAWLVFASVVVAVVAILIIWRIGRWEDKIANLEKESNMVVMAMPKPTAYVLKKGNSDKTSDEISNILEQIGDVQAELICRHQFGNSVRPALENISEKDLCERGIRLFYMLRNKYQGKDVVLRENKID